MTLHVEVYWSFRSPYSYFATHRLLQLEQDFDVACDVRVVYPIAVRDPGFFQRGDPLWETYFMRDVYRTAAFLGLPFRWPRPDPVVRDMKTRLYPREQPYIHRLSRLGVAAVERGRGLAFISQASRLIWSGENDDWRPGLAGAAEMAGLDLAEMDAAIAAAPERYDAQIFANQNAQRDAGHYGVPLMVLEGEPFFGQDRLDMLVWRMRQKGLAARA